MISEAIENRFRRSTNPTLNNVGQNSNRHLIDERNPSVDRASRETWMIWKADLSPLTENGPRPTPLPASQDKNSLKDRLIAIHDTLAVIQDSLDFLSSLVERVRNTFNFTVLYLSYMAIFVLSIASVFRWIVMIWTLALPRSEPRRDTTINFHSPFQFIRKYRREPKRKPDRFKCRKSKTDRLAAQNFDWSDAKEEKRKTVNKLPMAVIVRILAASTLFGIFWITATQSYNITGRCEWQSEEFLFKCYPKCLPGWNGFQSAPLNRSRGDLGPLDCMRGGTRRMCCFSDIHDSEWPGVWFSLKNEARVYCTAVSAQYDTTLGPCGGVKCNMQGEQHSTEASASGIQLGHLGNDCSELHIFGMVGEAIAGEASFFGPNSQPDSATDIWIKIGR
ncbi:multiple C2 and transmembrane domain-containing protein 2 [Ditylenchus destructor]|nr:multiple C2 and transmembrane domain-containing protein 2 [Ditylenchus destructor]